MVSLIQINGYTLIGQKSVISISDIPLYKSVNGSLTGQRVIDVSSANPRTEESFIEYAIINNVGNVSNLGTYVENIISSNTIRGTGEGIIRSLENNSMVGWNAYDLGKRTENGSLIYMGIIFFHILDPKDKDNEFMFLDNQVGVYENVIDDTGGHKRNLDSKLVIR